jgi:membrane associated rhomboid family serine protease
MPVVTIALIAANVLVYFLVQGGGIAHGPDAADVVGHGTVAGLFLHGGIVPLLVGMLFLWLFGASLEDSMSRPRFALLYLLGGLAAAGLPALLDPDGATPAIGSAGAVAAVLGGYLLLYPRGRVVAAVLVPFASTLVEVPGWLLVAIFFALQALIGATSLSGAAGDAGGATLLALLGGFLFGLLAVRLLVQRRKQVPPRVRGVLT